jgi:hypothetical protein
MQRRLDPSGTPCKDPLRLAEEFRVVLGEPALEGLIRDLATDEEWLLSELHKRLVQLPWVDIPRVGVEPTHKGFAVFRPSPKLLQNRTLPSDEVPPKAAF